MWELLNYLRAISDIEVWMLGLAFGATLVMAAIGITAAGRAEKPKKETK